MPSDRSLRWSTVPSTKPPRGLELLLVDSAPETAAYGEALREHYRVVSVTAHADTAIAYIGRNRPDLVITGLSPRDGARDLLAAARAHAAVPATLVTPGQPEEVPELLAVGCDGVLLKPFTRNLLINRVSRLLRARAEAVTRRVIAPHHRAADLVRRNRERQFGTNRFWPSVTCPHCSHQGATSFDYSSRRRAWFACPGCQKVWLGSCDMNAIRRGADDAE